jgi:exodeoxyribonuclease V gamma subunit
MENEPGRLQVLCTSRTEALLEELWRVVEAPPPGRVDPRYRECIVVQNQGMARWLTMQLGTRLGVWANGWFPYPQHFVRRLEHAVLDRAYGDATPLFEPEALRWAIAAALPELLVEPAFAPLHRWVGAGPDPGRILALAQPIAEVFDRYLLFRPDLLLAWEDGAPPLAPSDLPAGAEEDAAWQAPLWRVVMAQPGPGANHPVRRAEALIARLNDGTPDRLRERLPRVSVFGLSALSPLYVRILAGLARHVPVCVYTLAPGGFAPEQLAAQATGFTAATLNPAPPQSAAAEWLAASGPTHPLVEDQAGAVRAFQLLVTLAGAQLTVAEDGRASGARFAAAAGPARGVKGARSRTDGPTLLARLQADLALGSAPTVCPETVQAAIDGADASISLHSCHGPLREVEVLRDQLLAAFDELGDLAPHDVVVMAPDVEAYAPYIEAVFGVGRADGLAIPVRVADRAPRAERPGVQAFERALHVLRGRMTAPEVLDLLAMAPVRATRGLDQDALERLGRWVDEAGIRWGLDAGHRASVGQPALEGNTWRWGLARLVLGWAAPGDGHARYLDTLPFAPAGTEPALVGALADFVACLERWRGQLLEASLTLAEWGRRLGELAADLLGDGPDAADGRLLIERVLGELVDQAAAAGYTSAVGLDTVADLLAGGLAEARGPVGFLEGAVTVCALQPMRAVPFRVVALVGLNDGAFPRTGRPAGFDLVARASRLGDPSTRDTDRLLFLEALLCARDRLVLTWTGQDPRSVVELPPSVVVSELVDVLRTMAGAGAAGDDLVLRHRLHAFSPWYFGGHPDGPSPRWFSYSAAYAITARQATGPRGTRPALATAPLAPAPGAGAGRVVALDDLARFLEAPARRFVRDRLGVRIPERGAPLADREPMTLDALERHAVGTALLAALVDGATSDEAVAIATADGRLPLGTPGVLAVEPLRRMAERLAGLAAPLRAGGPPRSVAVDLALPAIGVRLVGTLDALWPTGRVEVGYGRLDLKRVLRLWVRHLALNVALANGAAPGCPPVSWAVGRAESRSRTVEALRLAPVADAPARLAEIVDLWFAAETHALPFFPHAARAYTLALAEADAVGDDEGARAGALRTAADAFGASRRETAPGDHGQDGADLDDAYLALALGDDLPWDPDGATTDPTTVARFEELARAVFGPLDAASARDQDDDARALVAALGP